MQFLMCGAIALIALAACNPTFNWRDVRVENAGLALLMPCKPDKAQRIVPMAGQPTGLNLLSCDADGVTFAVTVAEVKDASKANGVLVQWQSAWLANIKARPTTSMAFKLPGLPGGGVMMKAAGQRANGQVVNSQSAYFAQGAQVFQVVMYADTIAADVADTFFSSLKFE